MRTSVPQRRPGRRTVLVALLLVGLTCGVYWPLLKNGFINYDDPDYVTSNPRTQAGLSLAGLVWAFTTSHAGNWHPLTWLSHMLDCQLYGLHPAGHHLTSLLLHLANAVLLFLVLRRMTAALWPSAFVAALFAVHPLHVESVAWVAERKDVLCGLFFMLTLWAYVRYVEESKVQSPRSEVGSLESTAHSPQNTPPATGNRQPGRHYYGLALLLFTLGLMSKPMLVTLPFVLLLLDFWPLRRLDCTLPSRALKSLRRHLSEKLPFFVLAAASCLVTYLVQRRGGAVVTLVIHPLSARIANAFVAFARYLGKTVWPSHLAVFYPYQGSSWGSWLVIGSVFLFLTITAGVVREARRKPYLVVGWFWFVGMLIPVIGLVQVGEQALADRYTYLPSIGLFVLLGWSVTELVHHWNPARAMAGLCATIFLAGYGVTTVAQVACWHDTKTLFGHATAVTADNYVAQTVLASTLAEEGNLDEAITRCQLALRLSPNYPDAYITLGNIYTRQNNSDAAIASYRQAIQTDVAGVNPDPYYGIANALVKQQKYAEAEAPAREAVKRAPMHLAALFCLATALHNNGRLDEAVECYRRLLLLDPKLFTVHRYLGNALALKGQPDDAMSEFQLALQIRPGDADTHLALGLLLMSRNRPEEALARFVEATRLQPTNAPARYQLALVHQSRQETAAAINCYRAALAIQPNWPEALNNLAWILAASSKSGLRDGSEAVRLAERACELTHSQEPVLVGTLAAAYAEAGRFPEAIRSAEKARDLAQAAGQEAVAHRNQELLDLYRAGQAYHEKP